MLDDDEVLTALPQRFEQFPVSAWGVYVHVAHPVTVWGQRGRCAGVHFCVRDDYGRQPASGRYGLFCAPQTSFLDRDGRRDRPVTLVALHSAVKAKTCWLVLGWSDEEPRNEARA